MKPIIPDAALQQHVAVLGKTRSGKSSVLRGLVERLLDRELPVCIVDPKGDWWGIKLAKDGKRAGYPVVIFGGEHADVPINAHAGAHVAELFATGNRPCLIDLGGWMVGERTRFYIDFASTLFRLTKGMRYLCIDEIHNFAPKGKVMDPDAGKALHWTNRLASEGLGKGLPMLFASQRPQKVHNDTLTSAETLIAMRVLHPSDRGAVSDWIKGCGDLDLGAKVLASLAQMDRGEGWVWSPEIGLGPERVKFPMFKTYDSFRPQTAEDAAGLKGWASVDLDDVKTKLAKVVQEAEANDPKLLHARIKKLEGDNVVLRQGHNNALTYASNQLSEDVIDAQARGRREGYLAALEKVRDAADGLTGWADLIQKPIREFNGDLAGLIADAEKALAAVAISETKVQRPAASPRAAQAPKKVSTGTGEAMARAERQLLIVLAQRHPKPASRAQMSILSGYFIKSSSFANALSGLRSRGFMSGYGDTNTVTEAGLEALGGYDPLPIGTALISWWLGRLGKAERAFLEHIAGRYPHAVSKEELAGETGYSMTSSSYANALSKLRSLELIERGDIKASEELFG